jgi:hypothetical protein
MSKINLFESLTEDRRIISLSAVLYKRVIERLQILSTASKLGKIGDIVKLPVNYLPGIENICITLISDKKMRALCKAIADDDDDTYGLWEPRTKCIYLNKAFINTSASRSFLTHELRHVFDDLKSNYKAGASEYYSTPDKWSTSTLEPYYLGRDELNARFLQVLHHMVAHIKRIFRENPDNVKQIALEKLWKEFDHFDITGAFPEKEKSHQYRRFVSRALAFIDNEISYNKYRALKHTNK